MDKLRELAIYAIMKKIEEILIADIIPVIGNQLAYSVGTTLQLVDILDAKEKLDGFNIPFESRHMVVGSAQLNDIYNITGFTSSDFITSGAPLVSGQLPPALVGFMPHFTTMVGNVSYFFHSSFMTMASQMGIDVSLYDLGAYNGRRQTRVNCGTLFGDKQLDNTRVVTKS
jgi:hypothetical protein